MREPPGISEERLRARIREQYHFSPSRLEFLPIGYDFKAGVYRAVSEQETDYLIKVTSRPLYEPGYLVPRYLNNQGIEQVVAPIPAKSGALWTRTEKWTVIVYPFLYGESSFTGMTDGQWEKAGAIFKRIHQVILPPGGFESIRKETFNPSDYAELVNNYETRHLHSAGGNELERRLRTAWAAHQATIGTVVTSLEKLGHALRPRTFTHVICHADLHPANLIRTQDGQLFVIDWDEVMLAPKERDFIFAAQMQAHSFFKGYGDEEIDWPALTYYLLERVIQDLIECARDVCFREDLGEETKADALRLFQEILEEEGDHIAAAAAASKHLPPDLRFRMGKRD